MKQLWSGVLDIDTAEVKTAPDFFEMGGDSVKAIQLVSKAREQNVETDIESIFAHPRLSALAEHSRVIEEEDKQSSVEAHLLDRDLVKACASTCQTDENSIQDIFPSPYIQAMMLQGYIKTGIMVHPICVPIDRRL